MRLLHGASEVVAEWIGDHLKVPRGFGPCQAIGVLDGEALVGGVVFHGYSPEAELIEMSAVGITPRWLSRTVIRTVFRYAFDQQGCQLVVWRVSPDNLRTIRLAERLGFTGHRIPRLGGRHEDEIIFTLTDDAWRLGPFERGNS